MTWLLNKTGRNLSRKKIERRQVTYKNKYIQIHVHDCKLKMVHYISQIKFFRNCNSQWKTDGFIEEVK